MATTPLPLVWDCYRETGQTGTVGGVAHFYDESAQSFWNSGGLNSKLTTVGEGHWDSSHWSDEFTVSPVQYQDMDLDHPYSGTLFGVGVTDDSSLVFLRYAYAIDCTALVSSGTVSFSHNNAVAQLRANLMNTNESIFMSDATIFQPGAKVSLKIIVGDETPYNICVAYLDSVDYNIKSTTVPISGRNSIGFKLMQSTFDDETEIAGLPHEVVSRIMYLAGVTAYICEPGVDSRKHEFDPNQTLMSGLEQVCDLYPNWNVVELPNGTILVGSQSFLSGYQTNGYFVFQLYENGVGGKFSPDCNVFKRKTKRSSDASYTKVRITGKDADGNDLKPVTLPVQNYEYWSLPKNKTYHESAPDGLTQDELQSYAEDIAAHLQFVGVGEEFTSSIQPHLVIGDVAAFDNGDDTITPLGIVTSIKHSFGKSGFSTDFSTDSGGVLVSARSAITTRTKPLNGYNRKQTLKDLIQVASGASNAGPKTSGGVVKVSTTANASTLQGKTYDQIVAEAVEATLAVIQAEVVLAEQVGDTVKLYGVHTATQNGNTLEVR